VTFDCIAVNKIVPSLFVGFVLERPYVDISKNSPYMSKFIELQVTEELELKSQLINIDTIGRVYPDPQSTRRCIVELNYHSISDAPVYLEVEMPYEKLKAILVQP
jgi:hypothetical protein